MAREHFSSFDSVSHIWKTLQLPEDSLKSLHLGGDGKYFPSSFKVDHLAHASIALSALAASLFHSVRHHLPIRNVTVSLESACVEFKSERLYVLNGKPAPSTWGTIGGLHRTADGYIRMHDSFPNHR